MNRYKVYITPRALREMNEFSHVNSECKTLVLQC